MIELENITKKFSANFALSGIDIVVPERQFLSITGESGSGKSTLLSIMSGLDIPTTGKVIINGKDLSDFTNKEQAKFRQHEIGFIFQQFFLEPNYTVFQNIALPLLISKEKKDKVGEKVEKIARHVGLFNKLCCKAKTLSGGEMQRCCIARAFIQNPNIVFADEPCGNLDTKNGKTIMELLKNFHQQGNTVILVSHNPLEFQMAERIVTLKDGQIISDIFNK